MSYTIFGDKGSGAFCVEAALAEAGAPYEFKTVSLEKNEQREPSFLAVNPSGKMPALKLPTGEVVTESAGLLLTVADRHPHAKLLPPPASAERAQAYRWLAFMASELYPMVEISDYPDRFTPAGGEADALRTRAQTRLRERLLIVERNVAEPWFLPSGFSILDIYAAMFARWRGSLGRDWPVETHAPKLHALGHALAARPAIAPVWERHFGRR